MDDKIDRLKEIAANSKKMVAFTGAGISAESGIPTYRGTGGIWTKMTRQNTQMFNIF